MAKKTGYRIVHLGDHGSVGLGPYIMFDAIDVNVFGIGQDERNLLFGLTDLMDAYEAKRKEVEPSGDKAGTE